MNVADVLRAVSSVSWLLAFVVIGLAVFRATRNQTFKAAGSLVVGAVVLALLLTVVSAGLVFIQPEDRGVVISAVTPGGYRPTALEPGLHWIIPFAENVVTYPISKQTYTMSIAPSEGAIAGDDSIAARTADGQEVLVDASVIFALDPDQAVAVHIAWQDRYIDDLVRPVTRGVVRDVASQFGVEEIVSSKRIEMTEGVRAQISAKLAENGLILVDYVLRNITFSPNTPPSRTEADRRQQAQQAKLTVEQKKQEAEQARQTAQGQADARVIAAKGDAEARLINAEAEAKALELIAAALQVNPGLITYQYVQKLAPGIQVMLVPNDNPYLLPLCRWPQRAAITLQVKPPPSREAFVWNRRGLAGEHDRQSDQDSKCEDQSGQQRQDDYSPCLITL
jgi:regulator of protease activity HflC (stomatin/prohibitin superfamily)